MKNGLILFYFEVVHIERIDGILSLLFVHKYSDVDYLNAVEFLYMEEENKFAWYTSNGIYYFEKMQKTD